MAYKLWYERFPYNVAVWVLFVFIKFWIGIAKIIVRLQGK
jgi:hypothetical protein